MMFTKDDLRNAFLDGVTAGRKGCAYNLDEFNKWYATIHGARDKRIADAEWAKRMDDANRAAGVDLL